MANQEKRGVFTHNLPPCQGSLAIFTSECSSEVTSAQSFPLIRLSLFLSLLLPPRGHHVRLFSLSSSMIVQLDLSHQGTTVEHVPLEVDQRTLKGLQPAPFDVKCHCWRAWRRLRGRSQMTFKRRSLATFNNGSWLNSIPLNHLFVLVPSIRDESGRIIGTHFHTNS